VYKLTPIFNIMIAVNEPSICIPYVREEIEWKTINAVFVRLFGRGSIERVDLVRKVNASGESSKRAFIHFRYWSMSKESQYVRNKLMANEIVNITYDSPYFWKCSASFIAKPAPNITRLSFIKDKPYIKLDEEDNKNEK